MASLWLSPREFLVSVLMRQCMHKMCLPIIAAAAAALLRHVLC
jgi:hypothetical protein